MKKILLFMLPIMALSLASCEKVWTDDSPIIQFKDPEFLKALLYCNYVDRNGDGQISKKEASVVVNLSLYKSAIRNLEEIKYFTALTKLRCYSHQLTSLDLSNNTALTELSCYDNQLTTLDVSNNTALTFLSCSSNQLTTLDVSNNTALEELWCENNPLQKLILYKYHVIDDLCIETIESEYGDIIEYVE